jgi:outer membrane immunogenic protein
MLPFGHRLTPGNCRRRRAQSSKKKGDILVKKFLLTTVAFGLLALPAMAADMNPMPAAPMYKAPIPVPVFTWTGCYIGGTVGGVWGKTTDTWGPNPGGFAFPGPLTVSTSFNSSGATGGVEGGCNYQVSPWLVLGVEADWQATGLSGTFNGTAVTPIAQEPFTQTFSSHWLSTVRGRAGYAAGPWLFYATGGGAFANISRSDSVFFPTSGTSTAASQSTTATGWTAGAGVEWAFAPNWTVKAEYLYVDLPGTTFTSVNPSFPVSFITNTHGDLKENIVRVGANFKFW